MDLKSTTFLSAVGVGLIIVWLFVWPNIQEIGVLGSEVSEAEADIALLERTQENVQGSLVYFQKLSDGERELVELALPLFADKVGLVSLLDQLAAQNGMSVRTMSAGEASNLAAVGGESSNLSQVSVTSVLEGNYESMKEYLKSVELTLRIFDITQINATRSAENDDSSVLVWTVTGKAYFISEDTSNLLGV